MSSGPREYTCNYTEHLRLKGMSDTLLAVGYRNCLPWKQSVNFYFSLQNPRQNQCLDFYFAISKATSLTVACLVLYAENKAFLAGQ